MAVTESQKTQEAKARKQRADQIAQEAREAADKVRAKLVKAEEEASAVEQQIRATDPDMGNFAELASRRGALRTKIDAMKAHVDAAEDHAAQAAVGVQAAQGEVSVSMADDRTERIRELNQAIFAVGREATMRLLEMVTELRQLGERGHYATVPVDAPGFFIEKFGAFFRSRLDEAERQERREWIEEQNRNKPRPAEPPRPEGGFGVRTGADFFSAPVASAAVAQPRSTESVPMDPATSRLVEPAPRDTNGRALTDDE